MPVVVLVVVVEFVKVSVEFVRECGVGNFVGSAKKRADGVSLSRDVTPLLLPITDRCG
jgi:hypothetical protein